MSIKPGDPAWNRPEEWQRREDARETSRKHLDDVERFSEPCDKPLPTVQLPPRSTKRNPHRRVPCSLCDHLTTASNGPLCYLCLDEVEGMYRIEVEDARQQRLLSRPTVDGI